MTTWGLIARAESDRGLGVLTRLMYEHLSPDRTLLVTVDHDYVQETSAFPDATLVPFTGELDEQIVKEWLDGLDVVVSCETFYDWRVLDWARELGVKTILYVMPEFLKAENLSRMPTGTRRRGDLTNAHQVCYCLCPARNASSYLSPKAL